MRGISGCLCSGIHLDGAGGEVHLYVVPATNLSLATVGKVKRSQEQMRLELIVAAKS